MHLNGKRRLVPRSHQKRYSEIPQKVRGDDVAPPTGFEKGERK